MFTHRRPGSVALFALGLIAVVFAAVIVFDSRRRDVSMQARLPGALLMEEELEQGELAERIIARIRRHMALPQDVRATVATITNVTALQEKQPDFYAEAKNGDYLVITPTHAILYSSDRDILLNVTKVELERKTGE